MPKAKPPIEAADTKKEQRFGRGQNPKSIANLRPSKPGMTNNPKGKPPGTLDFKTRFEKKLFALAPEKVQLAKGIADFCKGIKAGEITNADAMDAVLIYKAIVERDLAAIKEALDRTEGKPLQKQEVTGKDGGPVEQSVIFKRAQDK